MTGNHSERLEAYIRNQLGPEEAALVQHDLRTDEDLQKEYRLLQLEFAVANKILKEGALDEIESWGLKKKSAKERRFRRTIKYGLILIALLITLICMWFLVVDSPFGMPALQHEQIENVKEPRQNKIPFPSEKPQNEQKESGSEKNTIEPQIFAFRNDANLLYESPKLFGSELRSAENHNPGDLRLLDSLFQLGEYSEILKKLNTISTTNKSLLGYQSGHIYFKMERFEDAIREFSHLTENEFNPFYEDAKWFLLLSYFAVFPKHEQEALQLANEMAKDKYNSRQKQSQQIYTTISRSLNR